jgi:flavin-dependent dehydrogenase
MSDVLVVGGGPAGTSVAIALATAGVDVTLVERACFPRPRIGESLPPKVGELLTTLGVNEAVAAAGFARMTGTTIVQDGDFTTHDFDPAQRELGYQVERERFDALLLERARSVGVRVREETTLVGLLSDEVPVGDGRTDVVVRGGRVRSADGQEAALAAQVVVDASGSAGVLSRTLGLKRRDAIRTVALCGYWRGSGVPPAVSPHNTLFETHPSGWLWSVRRADGLRNVTLGLDPAELKGLDPTAYYLEQVQRSTLMAPMLVGATLASEVTAHDATWFHAERVIGPGWILVGDAASLIDPLTSQGVYKALHSGLAAAAVLRTILTRPRDAELARRYYQASQDELHHNYVEVALSFYRGSPFADFPFWVARTRDDRPPRRVGYVDTVPDEPRQVRREAFLAAVALHGGRGLTLRRDARLVLVDTPVVERGLVLQKPQLGVDGLALPVPPGTTSVLPEPLWLALDGRTLEGVFEGYVTATGVPRSSDLGRALMAALTQLAELDLLTWTAKTPG